MASPMPPICKDNTKNAYIYGSISILVISLMSLVGAVIIPCLRHKSRHRWMQVFIALAVATMAGDALLHLIPATLGVHSHDHSSNCIKPGDAEKFAETGHDGHDHGDHGHDHGHDHAHHKRQVSQGDTGFDDFGADYGDGLFDDLDGAHNAEQGGHDHGDHGHDHADHKMPMIRMSVVFAAVYFFYLFEMVAHGIAAQRKKNRLKRRIKQYTPNGGSPYTSRPRSQVVPSNWGPIYDTPSQYYITDSDSGRSSSVSYAYGTGSHLPFASSVHPVAAATARWNYGQHHYHPAMGAGPYVAGPNVVALSDWWAKAVPNGELPPRPKHEKKREELMSNGGAEHGHGHSHGFEDKSWGDDQPDLCCGFKPLALLILIGDAVHNFADGMAVGVTFAKSNIAGFSTSLAVVCHELPHEIGDFAVLIDTGLPVWKALILNLISALTAFGGLYVGIVLGEDTAARPWLFAVAAGMFLYVAWVDMMHHLKEYKSDDPWYVNLALQNVGLVLGFVLIFLIGWFEEDIKI